MTTRIAQALKDVGATLKRAKKHKVFALPNGQNVVIASTPSDRRSEDNALRDIHKAAGVQRAEKAPAKPKAERRAKPGRPEPQWTLKGGMAEALRVAGVVDQQRIDRITELEAQLYASEGAYKRCREELKRCRESAGDTLRELSRLNATRWVRIGRWIGLVR